MKSTTLVKILTDANVLPEADLTAAVQAAETLHTDLEKHLIDQNIISENVLYETIASYYKLPFVDLKQVTIRKDVLEAVPEPLVQVHQVVAYDMNRRKLNSRR